MKLEDCEFLDDCPEEHTGNIVNYSTGGLDDSDSSNDTDDEDMMTRHNFNITIDHTKFKSVTLSETPTQQHYYIIGDNILRASRNDYEKANMRNASDDRKIVVTIFLKALFMESFKFSSSKGDLQFVLNIA